MWQNCFELIRPYGRWWVKHKQILRKIQQQESDWKKSKQSVLRIADIFQVPLLAFKHSYTRIAVIVRETGLSWDRVFCCVRLWPETGLTVRNKSGIVKSTFFYWLDFLSHRGEIEIPKPTYLLNLTSRTPHGEKTRQLRALTFPVLVKQFGFRSPHPQSGQSSPQDRDESVRTKENRFYIQSSCFSKSNTESLLRNPHFGTKCHVMTYQGLKASSANSHIQRYFVYGCIDRKNRMYSKLYCIQ